MHRNFPNLFAFVDKYNQQVFKNNITNIGVIYRNYNDPKRKIELIKIKKACKKKGYQLYVSNSIKLALQIKADGIYIPAFNKSQKFRNLGKKNFVILGSAHNEREIQEKIMQKCKAIFVSPIFNVKKTNKFLGIEKFNLLTHSKKIAFYALGGISEKNINKLRLLNNIKGFGGMNIFKKKPAFKRPVFLKN